MLRDVLAVKGVSTGEFVSWMNDESLLEDFMGALRRASIDDATFELAQCVLIYKLEELKGCDGCRARTVVKTFYRVLRKRTQNLRNVKELQVEEVVPQMSGSDRRVLCYCSPDSFMLSC